MVETVSIDMSLIVFQSAMSVLFCRVNICSTEERRGEERTDTETTEIKVLGFLLQSSVFALGGPW